MILRHFTAGKFSQNKASDLAISFILGAETATMLILFALCLVTTPPALTEFFHGQVFAWIMAGILICLGLIFPIIYFKKGPGTQLFISRQLASRFRHRVTSLKSSSDAFALGFAAVLPELIFTLPLYLLSSIALAGLAGSFITTAFAIVVFSIVAISPLLILHGLPRSRTLADFLRFRFHHKTFTRFFVTFLYFLLAGLIIAGVLL